MNALFGEVIKVFLALVQAQDAVCQDHGDLADGDDERVAARVEFGGHEGLYGATPAFFSTMLRASPCCLGVTDRAPMRDSHRSQISAQQARHSLENVC